MMMADGLTTLGHEVGVFAPDDRSGQSHERVHKVPLQHRARRARARELSLALPQAAEAAGFEIRIACGKIRHGTHFWPHGGVHAAALRVSTAAGRGSLRGVLARWARSLRAVEYEFKAIERDNAEAARRGSLKMLAISDWVATHMASYYQRPVAELSVVRNACPPSFQPVSGDQRAGLRARFSESLGLNEEALWIVFVAMNPRLKGAARLRAVTCGQSQYQILYIGQRPFRRALGNECFLGLREDVADIMAAADVLAQPSHYDPCSLVTLEAMATGLPIITTGCNGAVEILKAGESFLLAETESEWRGALKRLESVEARRTLAKAARLVAREWTPERAATEFLAAL